MAYPPPDFEPNEASGVMDPKKFNPYSRTQQTKPGEQKPCDLDISQNDGHPEWPNYIESICYRWMRSQCKGRHSSFCPGYIFHKDPSYVNVPYGSASLPQMGTLLGE